MKCVLFTMVVVLVCMTVRATNDRTDHMYEGLGTIFNINENEVIACFNKTGATREDVRVLQASTPHGFDLPENQPSVKKAVCALVCCAQKQGTMVGDKIQAPIIHDLINKSDMPIEVKGAVNAIITECSEQVKGLTGDCNVGLRFFTCLTTLSEYFGY
ncbi:uncharacterized protein LOC122396865 [Colletes gigas]|uniref:uncharacterized protein LOC122396865 n=1 Tax=Colletes gigas TaxID=935657 RepID=UPI001C9BA8E6|nr:uncharacterized protein LOC122396865 [Colletes gigas]